MCFAHDLGGGCSQTPWVPPLSSYVTLGKLLILYVSFLIHKMEIIIIIIIPQRIVDELVLKALGTVSDIP